jgi:hypothetical protein
MLLIAVVDTSKGGVQSAVYGIPVGNDRNGDIGFGIGLTTVRLLPGGCASGYPQDNQDKRKKFDHIFMFYRVRKS